FLKKAAETSYRQVLWQKFLEGQKVKQFMRPNPITVPSGISLQQFVEDFVYTYHHRVFPVVEDARLLGCIHVRALKNISKEEWPKRTVAELMEKCSLKNTVSPDEDANQVLTRMNRTGNTRLLVVEDEKLLGIVSLKDMLSFISLRLELEGAGQPSWL
ncbi:MAG TPA: CBS domain-containing protein, partial [bacterium]|nr:CBS domain-containing protein [bacterium]